MSSFHSSIYPFFFSICLSLNMNYILQQPCILYVHSILKTYEHTHGIIKTTFYLHFKSWITFFAKFTFMVQFILAYFFFITFIKCTFPLNLPWLVSVKILESISLLKFELLSTTLSHQLTLVLWLWYWWTLFLSLSLSLPY